MKPARKVCASALALAVLGLTACAGSAPAFYSLVAPSGAPVSLPPRAASVLVQPLGVRVPDALDRREMVVLSGAQQVLPLSGDLWRSSLPQELQTAVMTAVLADGRIAQAPASGIASAVPVYGLHLGLDRLDVALGQYVRMDVSWSVQRLPASPGAGATVCRASWQQSLHATDLNAAVALQQQLVQQWGQRIQRQLLHPDKVSACGAES